MSDRLKFRIVNCPSIMVNQASTFDSMKGVEMVRLLTAVVSSMSDMMKNVEKSLKYKDRIIANVGRSPVKGFSCVRVKAII